MYQSIVKLFGFNSAASWRSRPSRKNSGRAFRPAFDHLEAREVPTGSALRPTFGVQTPVVASQNSPIATASSQPTIAQQAVLLPGANSCPANQNCFDVSATQNGPIAVVALQPANALFAELPGTNTCPAGQNCFTV